MQRAVPDPASLAGITSAVHPEVDVCIIVEGCYPYIAGGVSGWIDWLIRTQPQTRFAIVTLWPRPTDLAPRYQLPPNVVSFQHLYLQDFGARPVIMQKEYPRADRLADALTDLIGHGGATALRTVMSEFERLRGIVPPQVMFNSPMAWQIVRRMYDRTMPYSSFLDFFWAWRALLGGLFATLEFPLPKARAYHTISTGYAGVLAARAALETGRPAVLTEHGIYTNERRIELLMADWVADTVDKGHALDDPRVDLRDMWIQAFEGYARTCYEACSDVVTLYEDNQRAQRVLGATEQQLSVIANGIDLARFAKLATAADDARPTMALIGRVVPIKDVKSFIAAAHLLRAHIPNLHALILGPTDEDPEYFAECERLVRDLDVAGTVEFTGTVNIVDYMPRIHVCVLTSLSESQPLVILEAGAARIPFVATNVGSCREIIEGRPDEVPALGPGGIVCDLVAPNQIANAVGALLLDPQRRRRCGEALLARVANTYTSRQAVEAYTTLYARLVAMPTAQQMPLSDVQEA
ncbi:MAG: GT4 family glycosyltransferase PelF [Hyphomicrobiaceae bacterium]